MMKTNTNENIIYVSNCCGEEAHSNGDTDTKELGFCGKCRDHCIYIAIDEEGNEVETT